MPIPNFQSTMLPMLDYLADKVERSNKEIYTFMDQFFSLSEEEKNVRFASGNQRVFVNRIAWGKSFLKQAGLIESPQRGHYVITDAGMRVARVEKPTKIDVKYLQQFPVFRLGRESRYDKDSAPHDVDERQGEDKTPEEYIEQGMGVIVGQLKNGVSPFLLKLPMISTP